MNAVDDLNQLLGIGPPRPKLPITLQRSGYSAVKLLGKGSFGSAYLVFHSTLNSYFVVKHVNMSSMNKKQRQEARNEITVLQQLQHPNIVQYVEFCEEFPHLYIIMEYADGGDLYTHLKKIKQTHMFSGREAGVTTGRSPPPGFLTEDQVLSLFVQVTMAVKHMHDRHLLHRDIKSQNVFITSNHVVKLGDFGISTFLKNTMAMASTMCGTPSYFSPELCHGRPYNNKSDVWALGVLLYELASGGRLPFAESSSMKRLMRDIVSTEPRDISSYYSTELKQLIRLLLVKDPKHRPDAAQVLQMPVILRAMPRIMQQLAQSASVQPAPIPMPLQSPRSRQRAGEHRAAAELGTPAHPQPHFAPSPPASPNTQRRAGEQLGPIPDGCHGRQVSSPRSRAPKEDSAACDAPSSPRDAVEANQENGWEAWWRRRREAALREMQLKEEIFQSPVKLSSPSSKAPALSKEAAASPRGPADGEQGRRALDPIQGVKAPPLPPPRATRGAADSNIHCRKGNLPPMSESDLRTPNSAAVGPTAVKEPATAEGGAGEQGIGSRVPIHKGAPLGASKALKVEGLGIPCEKAAPPSDRKGASEPVSEKQQPSAKSPPAMGKKDGDHQSPLEKYYAYLEGKTSGKSAVPEMRPAFSELWSTPAESLDAKPPVPTDFQLMMKQMREVVGQAAAPASTPPLDAAAPEPVPSAAQQIECVGPGEALHQSAGLATAGVARAKAVGAERGEDIVQRAEGVHYAEGPSIRPPEAKAIKRGSVRGLSSSAYFEDRYGAVVDVSDLCGRPPAGGAKPALLSRTQWLRKKIGNIRIPDYSRYAADVRGTPRVGGEEVHKPTETCSPARSSIKSSSEVAVHRGSAGEAAVANQALASSPVTAADAEVCGSPSEDCLGSGAPKLASPLLSLSASLGNSVPAVCVCEPLVPAALGSGPEEESDFVISGGCLCGTARFTGWLSCIYGSFICTCAICCRFTGSVAGVEWLHLPDVSFAELTVSPETKAGSPAVSPRRRIESGSSTSCPLNADAASPLQAKVASGESAPGQQPQQAPPSPTCHEVGTVDHEAYRVFRIPLSDTWFYTCAMCGTTLGATHDGVDGCVIPRTALDEASAEVLENQQQFVLGSVNTAGAASGGEVDSAPPCG